MRYSLMGKDGREFSYTRFSYWGQRPVRSDTPLESLFLTSIDGKRDGNVALLLCIGLKLSDDVNHDYAKPGIWGRTVRPPVVRIAFCKQRLKSIGKCPGLNSFSPGFSQTRNLSSV